MPISALVSVDCFQCGRVTKFATLCHLESEVTESWAVSNMDSERVFYLWMKEEGAAETKYPAGKQQDVLWEIGNNINWQQPPYSPFEEKLRMSPRFSKFTAGICRETPVKGLTRRYKDKKNRDRTGRPVIVTTRRSRM